MKKFKYFFLAGAITLIACNSTDSESDIIRIDLAEGFNNTGEIKLSELVSEVELVQFEPGTDTWFFNARSVSFGKKYIMIADDGQDRIILFTRDGKFVRHIGRQGKGPGEYTNPWESAMDPNDQFIFTHDGMSNKLIKFDTDGKFIKEIKTEDMCYEERFIDGIRFIDDQHFVLLVRRPRSEKEDFGSLPMFDLDLNLVERILPRSKDQQLVKSGRAHLNRGSHRMYFWEPKQDTFYTITPDGESIATHLITSSKLPDKTYLFSADEYGKYFFVYAIGPDERYNLAYNAETEECFSLQDGGKCDTTGVWTGPTITNDLFGLEPVFIDRYVPEIDRYIAWHRPEYIGKGFDYECLREKEMKYPEILEEILRISSDEEESQNMLMILLKPKKNH